MTACCGILELPNARIGFRLFSVLSSYHLLVIANLKSRKEQRGRHLV